MTTLPFPKVDTAKIVTFVGCEQSGALEMCVAKILFSPADIDAYDQLEEGVRLRTPKHDDAFIPPDADTNVPWHDMYCAIHKVHCPQAGSSQHEEMHAPYRNQYTDNSK